MLAGILAGLLGHQPNIRGLMASGARDAAAPQSSLCALLSMWPQLLPLCADAFRDARLQTLGGAHETLDKAH